MFWWRCSCLGQNSHVWVEMVVFVSGHVLVEMVVFRQGQLCFWQKWLTDETVIC